MLKNTNTTYGSVAKFFHWLIFLFLLLQVTFGFFLSSFPKDSQGMAYNTHKLFGAFILLFVLARLLWKVYNVAPLLPIGTPKWQIALDHIVQWLLYLVIIAMPIAGLVGSVAMRKPPHIGNFVIMLPIAPNKALGEAAFYIHNTLAVVLIVLFVIHVLAAFYHFFIKKDNVMQRMMPGG